MRRLLFVSLTSLALACGPSDRTSQATDAGVAGDAGGADASNLPFVCNPQTDDNPDGLKAITYLDSADSVYPEANWRAALEPETQVNWATFSGAKPHESAMLLDLPESDVELAGFLVTRTGASETAVQEMNLALAAIEDIAPSTSLTVRSSGSNIVSLDGFDTVISASIEVKTTGATDVTGLREAILPALLGRAADDVSFPDVGWQSGSDTRFILAMQTLYRAESDQTLFMGALVRAYDYEDRHRATALHADDLSNGSGLTKSLNGEARECEDEALSKQALADIIWIDDESITMDADRASVASNATTFFERAELAGLDFRMGVTEIDDEKMGVFASRDAASPTGDRWVMPGELATFQDNINDPSGPEGEDCCEEHGLTVLQQTIERHLPRSNTIPSRIREDAALVVILMSDERPQEFEDADIFSGGGKVLITPEQAAQVAEAIAPVKALLAENNVTFHLIALEEGGACNTEIGYGYFDLATSTGGQFGSICQTDLGSTIDAIIEQVFGDASPTTLEFVPISSSITVMRDGVAVPRSRERGWDYRSASNSIVFYGMDPVSPADPAEVTIGYRRWKEQVVE